MCLMVLLTVLYMGRSSLQGARHVARTTAVVVGVTVSARVTVGSVGEMN